VDYSLIANRTWVPGAIEILKEVVNLRLRIQFIKKELDILNHARKKTTQKVNLYEKVQIPEYESAIQKIKRFLEDAENLSRSSQKLIKIRRESELTL
jgi:V/A-type H+-transporting ATPase subunit D